jgi:hypothetical protein
MLAKAAVLITVRHALVRVDLGAFFIRTRARTCFLYKFVRHIWVFGRYVALA